MILGVASGIKKEFLYGGHLFALGSVGVVFATSVVGSFAIDPIFFSLVYLIYYSIYLYDHSSGTDIDFITNPIRAEYLRGKKEKEKYVFLILAFIISIILIYKNDLFIVIASLATLILGILYGKLFKGITRRILGFKNYFVAAFWGIIVMYSALCHGVGVDLSVLLFALFVFLRMLSVQIFFDIRDIEGDKIKKLLTFPIFFGLEKSIKIIYFINLLSILVVSGAVFGGYWRINLLLLLAISIYSADYIHRYYNNKLYCYLCAAGEPIIWSSLVILSTLGK